MLQFDVFQPEVNNYPGTAICAPYPLAGNFPNSCERFAATAHAAGVPIVAWQRPGASNTGALFSRQLRHDLSPEHFQDSLTLAEDLAASPTLENFDSLVGWADSAAGPTIIGTQRFEQPFKALLLRDCILYDAPKSVEETEHAFIAYLTKVEPYLPPDPDAPRLPPEQGTWPWPFHHLRTLGRVAAEMSLTKRLQCSSLPSGWLSNIARMQLDIPINYVGLTGSFTGNKAQAEQFIDGLKHTRRLYTRLDELAARPCFAAYAPVTGMVRAAHHAQLTSRPDWAAQDLTDTLKLL